MCLLTGWALALIIGLSGGKIAEASETAVDNVSTPIVSRIRIAVEGPAEKAARLQDLARSLIVLEEGAPFSAEGFQQSLNMLKASGVFEAIDVPDPVWDSPPIELFFNLTPFRRVTEVRVYGAFPLFEQDIINAMGLRSGDRFIPDKIADNQSAVTRYLRNEGYISPEASFHIEPASDGFNVILQVRLDKGDYFRLTRVEIDGNQAFSDERLKLRCRTWRTSKLPFGLKRFIRKDLDTDTKNLVEFYRTRDFPEVTAKAELEELPASREVHITVRIDEGPRYRVAFEGNREFLDYTLKKDLVFAKEGNRNDFGLRKSIRNIISRYRDSGYENVSVRSVAEMSSENGQDVRTVRLVIDEGGQALVGSVTISGNRAVDEETIRTQMLTQPRGIIGEGAFVPDVFDDDQNAVGALYLKRGYLNPTITGQVRWGDSEEPGKRSADVVLAIEEGVQTLVESVSITGMKAVAESEAMDTLALKTGDPLRPYMIESDENTLASMISEMGYPHVTVTGSYTLENDGESAAVTYHVVEGPFVRMGEVYTIGNFKTRNRIVRREVEIETGEPFSLKNMLESQKNIRNLDPFESVRFITPGLKAKSERANLIVEVEEKKPYYLELGLGYDTERRSYGNIRLGDRNLFGLNKNGWVRLEGSEIGYFTELGLVEPRFFGTRISSNINLFAEEREEFNQDFGTRTAGASMSLKRKLPWHMNATLATSLNSKEQYARESRTVEDDDPDIFDRRTILVVTPALTYNSTDSFLRPKRGVSASASVDISKGVENSLDDFLKYRLELRRYVSPKEWLTFAFRGRYGYIDPFSDASSIPDDQLFFLGGVSSVRGFDVNTLRLADNGDGVGGREEILGNIEARIDVGLNFEAALFYDIGSIQSALVDEGTSGFRSSAGFGLRYITPIGAAGFLYGVKLDRRDGESPGEFHIALGYTF